MTAADEANRKPSVHEPAARPAGGAVPRELLQAVRTGDCVPFLGAGISRPSGMPGWGDIVGDVRAHLSELLNYAVSESDLDFLQVPQMYPALAGSDQPLRGLLDEAFLTGFESNGYHHALAQLPLQTYITTNWDVLLERALEQQPLRAPVAALYRDEHVADWSEAQTTSVIKLHGTIKDHRSIVFSEDQYLDRYTGDSLLFQLVRVLLASRSVLMIGFSYSDPFVKLLFHQVGRLVADSRKPHWFVTSEDRVTPIFLEYLRHHGFFPIVLPSAVGRPEAILQFLQLLASETTTVVRDRSLRARLLRRVTEPLLTYRGSERVLRIRATLGPFGSPEPDSEDDVFGSAARDEEEYALHRICVELVERHGFRIRLLARPTSLEALLAKGYTRRQSLRRIRAFAATAARLGDRLDFAPVQSSSDRNQWIAANRSVVESWKEVAGSGQLYSQAMLREERGAVMLAARLFEEDFEEATQAGGGPAQTRAQLVEDLKGVLGE